MDIKALYRDFITKNGRREDMSISLQSGLYLFRRLNELKPKRILDTGSGFSTLVIRSWQKENAPESVVTTDLDAEWLALTQSEARELGLSIDHFYLHDEFECFEPFDFVFIDLGTCRDRLLRKEKLISYVKFGGLVVLDDWHKKPYRLVMRRFLKSKGYKLRLIEETRDRFGRFMIEVR